MNVLPAWAHWNPSAAAAPWTVGVEEEVMLVDPGDWSLASRIDDVLPALSHRIAAAASAETHGCALELAQPAASDGRRRGGGAGGSARRPGR